MSINLSCIDRETKWFFLCLYSVKFGCPQRAHGLSVSTHTRPHIWEKKGREQSPRFFHLSSQMEVVSAEEKKNFICKQDLYVLNYRNISSPHYKQGKNFLAWFLVISTLGHWMKFVRWKWPFFWIHTSAIVILCCQTNIISKVVLFCAQISIFLTRCSLHSRNE